MKQNKAKENYTRAEKWLSNVIKNGHNLLFNVHSFDIEIQKASMQFNLSCEALNSFLRNKHLAHVKKRSFHVRSQLSHTIAEYCSGRSICLLAKKLNYPPSLLARTIVEKLTPFEKKDLTRAIANPMRFLSGDVIHDQYRNSEDVEFGPNVDLVDPFSGKKNTSQTLSRLAAEVFAATNSDPLYGPRFDRERNFVGIEYEIILERTLSSMNIPFETEEELREKGTSRTPDILLSCPVAIKVHKSIYPNSQDSFRHGSDDDAGNDFVWKMVNWIDSKALYGDVTIHQSSVLPQAEAYIHRFGPGLIIYWFGHAPIEMLQANNADIIVASSLPDQLMVPTGQIVTDGSILE